jgi:hypothetical protein
MLMLKLQLCSVAAVIVGVMSLFTAQRCAAVAVKQLLNDQLSAAGRYCVYTVVHAYLSCVAC